MEFNIADLFESVADALPERTALVCGDRSLSYAKLDERASRLAHWLRARGLGAGDHVGLYLRNGTEYIEAMLAAFKIRAVPINVNFRYVEDELRYLFEDADLAALFHHRDLGPRVASVAPKVPAIHTLLYVEDGSAAALPGQGESEYEAALAESSPERGFPPRSGDDLYIIYTGGTTGMPKGVMWRHEDAFYSCLMGANPYSDPAERPEQVAERAREKAPMCSMPAPPLIHGAAQLGTLIFLMQGSKVVLTPRYEPELVCRAIEREGVQTLSLVGDAMARPLAEHLAEHGGEYDLSSLIVLSSAGALLSPVVKAQLEASLPKLMIIDAFGSSETGSQGGDAGGALPGGGFRFRMNEHTAVLDEDLEPIEPGSGRTGRVALRGHIPIGYYNDPEKSAATFVEKDRVRWVLAGDMARPEADGTVVVLGRGSECINSGGEKIFPEEVEGALKSHPEVFDAVVVGIPDPRWGQKVAAVVQPRPGASPALEALDRHCRTKIAGYKVPRGLVLVDEMVRSPSGKADYPWARALAREHLA